MEVVVMLLAQLANRKPTNAIEVLSGGVSGMLHDVPRRDVDDVLAVIAAFGQCQRLSMPLMDPGLRAEREILDLRAGVVVVELARHRPPGPLEQRGDGVAEGGLAAVSDVQRAGGIGAHELHVHGTRCPCVRAAVRLPRLDERRDAPRDYPRIHAEVDESRTGHFGGRDACRRAIDAVDQLEREIAWLPREGLRQHHREIRGPIAERGIARALEQRLDVAGRAERSRRALELTTKRVGARAHSDVLGLLVDAGLVAGVASALLAAGADDSALGVDLGSPVDFSAFSPFSAVPSDFDSDFDSGAVPRCAFLP